MPRKRSIWTIEALHEYHTAMAAERDKRYEQRWAAERDARVSALASAQLAVDKAERDALRWQENANEWRQAMSDKDRMLPTRQEVDKAFEAMTDKVDTLAKYSSETYGRAGGRAEVWGWIAGGFGLLIAFAVFAFEIIKASK